MEIPSEMLYNSGMAKHGQKYAGIASVILSVHSKRLSVTVPTIRKPTKIRCRSRRKARDRRRKSGTVPQGGEQEQECRSLQRQSDRYVLLTATPEAHSTNVVVVEVPSTAPAEVATASASSAGLDARQTCRPRPACPPWLPHRLTYRVYQKYLQTGMRK